MIAALRAGKGLTLLAAAGLLAGCGGGVPDFVGREGAGANSFYSIRGKPQPVAVRVPMRSAIAEPALYGMILRVEGLAPTWGYHTASLRPLGDGPDAAGIMSFQFMAIPPDGVEPAGAPRTREISAAIFVPNISLKKLRGVRVTGVGQQVQTLPIRQG
jgi:hypothetical protein